MIEDPLLFIAGAFGCITLSIILDWMIHIYDEKYMRPLRKGTIYE